MAQLLAGSEWLGEVPSHWGTVRLKSVASTNDDILSEKEDPLRPMSYVDISSVDSSLGITQIEEMVFEDAPSRARRLVRDGDTIVSTVRTYLRAIASITDPPPTMVVSTGFAVIRPQTLDPGFSAWAIRGHGFVEEVVARSVGVSYPAINASEIGNIPIAVPPPGEQREIAAFLDRETERIDSLIAKKRLLIERLQEYRTALITRTVTRGLPPEAARAAGLDPSPRLKPSGVDWLGVVPEHWDVARLGSVATYRTSSVDKKTVEGEWPVRLCNYTDVYYRERIRAREEDFMAATASSGEIERFRLRVGDVLITKDSEDWEDIGVPALVEEAADDFLCGYHLGIIRPGPRIEPAMLLRIMQSSVVNRQLQVSTSGITRYGLPKAAVTDALMPIPPLSEQRAIAEFLDRQMILLTGIAAAAMTAIERLGEYRTALITAAVTGKIDVRGAASSGRGSAESLA